MSYQLTLSKGERKAIDWIGYRYFHGDELFDLLTDASVKVEAVDGRAIDPEECWQYAEGELRFTMPENIAWQIREGIESEGYELACFDRDLRSKLLRLCDNIV